ncbi:MAG: hypothetical protein M1829_003196 [Trizodia sp. TS-e1964]|nr:MAG: hypothetical protein M1829_003196 [Trizodia sp. TS-e1964]
MDHHQLNRVLFPHNLFPRDNTTGVPGSATTTSNSLSGFLSTLIPVLLTSTALFVLFLVLRRTQNRQYSPRTYLGSLRENQRTPKLPNGMFNWFGAFFNIPDTHVLNHHSLDGFLLLRYLKIVTVISLVGCLITWPVLFPVNATGGGGGEQLDLLSMSNIADKNRYYAHTFVAWIFFGFILYMVTRESIFYINLRQAYLLSPLYAHRMSSRTVLFTSVPDAFLDEGRLRRMFGAAVKNIWIATDCKEVSELVQERDKVAFKLEAAETSLIKLANANRLKALKKNKGATADAEGVQTEAANVDGESGSIASQWVPAKKRPSHKLKFLIGKKVDTIDWSRSELERIIPRVTELQGNHRGGEGRRLNSVFIEFHTQTAAQGAYQSLAHHQPLHMSPRFIGISPEEVIWSNLRIKWWERIIRKIATTSFVTALIVFWAIPVAVVGLISQINYLTDKLPWLSFINSIPPAILGVITGLLPVVMLAVLMALLPIILKLMAKLGGAPSLSQVELSCQGSYFWFQVIQVFLVTTLSSAASAAIQGIINDPGSAPSLLSSSIPKASNFYISYFVLQGLTISSGAVLQIVGLILFKVLGKFLDNTPRKIYKRWSSLSGLGWGTIFPVFTNMAVIAITYSCIAPLILGFASVGLWLVYLAFRYNLLFVNDAEIDTQGLVYPRALQQTLVGVYLAEVCMIGIFGIKGAAGPIILMVILLIFTVLYHVSLNSALDPLLKYLPKSLEDEEESLLALESGQRSGDETGKGAEMTESPGIDATPHPKPNLFAKWLHPDLYTDYATMRQLVPKDFSHIVYSGEAERDAYYNPAISSPTPLLWIPRDPMGVSKQEIHHTSHVIPITDEGAHLDETNKIITDEEVLPPIYEPKIYY